VSQLKFSNLARLDLQSIHDYIASDNLDAATKFIEKLHYRCLSLAEAPKTGRSRDELSAGVRMLLKEIILSFIHQLVMV
jgi:plasmid stabilization system protein ParE